MLRIALAILIVFGVSSASADTLLLGVGGGANQGGGGGCTPGQLTFNVACNAVFHQGNFQ